MEESMKVNGKMEYKKAKEDTRGRMGSGGRENGKMED